MFLDKLPDPAQNIATFTISRAKLHAWYLAIKAANPDFFYSENMVAGLNAFKILEV